MSVWSLRYQWCACLKCLCCVSLESGVSTTCMSGLSMVSMLCLSGHRGVYVVSVWSQRSLCCVCLVSGVLGVFKFYMSGL